MSKNRYRSRKKNIDINCDDYLFDSKNFSDEKKEELQIIFNSHPRMELEIGCGCGHFIQQKAAENNDLFFLAAEIKLKIIKKAARKIILNNLNNVKFLVGDILFFMEYIPDGILERVYINFPDPWRKKRHHKRRLIQQPFLDNIAGKMKTGAELYFVTDNIDYLTYSIEQFKINTNFQPCIENYGILNEFEGYPQSLYESLFRKDGVKINYTFYKKK